MNSQQARIKSHLVALRNMGRGDSNAVDLMDQTRLAAEGYDLSALDTDLQD